MTIKIRLELKLNYYCNNVNTINYTLHDDDECSD